MTDATSREDGLVSEPDGELSHAADFGLRHVWRYRLWVPGHAGLAFRHGRRPGERAHPRSAANGAHLVAAAEWLRRAQDATPDGGVVGRYRLDSGWTTSYPETTGYILPTMIALSGRLGGDYLDRAARCRDFLLSTQLESGAFPAGEIGENTSTPSPFNTAQILHGLLSWHRHAGDDASLASARRAGAWLVGAQDGDGAWRKSFYGATPATYSAHLSCWLADLGAHCDDARFVESATRHLDWVLAQRDADTGWFDRCGFKDEQHANRVADTHAIGYTLGGLLRLASVLGRDDAREAVVAAARPIADRLEETGWLPGMLDRDWQPRADSACLTGNAQLALVWMELHEHDADERWLRAARAAIELVRRGQSLESSNPALRGAISGADPFWGCYNEGAVISWAAKFFIDASLKLEALTETAP